ncbi:UDP-glycosyltransferase 92A1-like [Aristolochia californica]|uniref:UDP-glycosyltransferase 92A1-like n=1 Tax=Aristolochia californica TaxID=171875 RepID=UPI0035DADBD2
MALRSEEHLILFPFLAQGHIIPFMALARVLEQRTGYTITFVNTSLNIRAARTAFPSTTKIRFAELPFDSSDHGLPPNSENTDALSFPLIGRLLEVTLTLRPAFEQLISDIIAQDGRRPLCIISDFFFGWTVDVAKSFGIFHSMFISSGAYGTAVYFSLWLHLPHSKTNAEEFPLPDFPEPVSIHRSQLSNHLSAADGTDRWSLFLQPQLSSCLRSDAILFNTVAELDGFGLKYFREKMGDGKVWPIGPISSILKTEVHRRKEPAMRVDVCIEWLNQHPPASVLYISFGSMNTLSASQMMELAIGLEESGKPFIWVIRPPLGQDINGESSSEWLPEGYEERMKERKRGILIHRWAPQLEILSHKSTGAFLSHCGWNSTVESLTRGVPMIGWPLSGEQFYNSQMLEEVMGVSVEIARSNRSEIHHGHVVAMIEMVMGDTEKRKDMTNKSQRVKEMFDAAVREEEGFQGSSLRALDGFINAAAISTTTMAD